MDVPTMIYYTTLTWSPWRTLNLWTRNWFYIRVRTWSGLFHRWLTVRNLLPIARGSGAVLGGKEGYAPPDFDSTAIVDPSQSPCHWRGCILTGGSLNVAYDIVSGMIKRSSIVTPHVGEWSLWILKIWPDHEHGKFTFKNLLCKLSSDSDTSLFWLGLKTGQRKVLYTCLRRNDKREVKVAQLAGSIAELSAYHHGEVRFFLKLSMIAGLHWWPDDRT